MFIFSLVDHTSSSGSSSRASEPWNRTLSLVSISLFHLDQEKAMADDRRAICSYIQFVTMEFYQGETKKKLDRPLPRWILCTVNIKEIMIRRYKDFFFLLIFIENILITLTCILETKVLWNHQCWTSSFSDLVLNADIFGGVFCREQVDARLLHDLRNHCQYIGQIKLTVTQSSQNRQKRSLKNDNIQ